MAHRYLYHFLLLTLAVIVYSPVNLDAKATDGQPVILSSPASQGSFLRLVGTAVAGDPQNSLAVIEDQQSRKQAFFREGNQVYGILIKSILRDRIIVDAGRGDELVKLKRPLIAGTKPQIATQAAVQPAKQAFDATQPVNVTQKTGRRHRTVTLARETVDSALADIDQTLSNVYIVPGGSDFSPGFRVTSFEPGSIFSQLGLRNYDLVMSVNDQKLNGSENAKTFLEKIREGGNLDFKIRRRARIYTIHLNIE